VVGDYTNSQGITHGFIYNGSTLANFDDPLGALGSSATGISGSTIVGNFSSATNEIHGYIYNGGNFATFDAPIAGSSLTGINGIYGTTVVGQYSGSGVHGFIFDGTTFTTLDDPLAEPVGFSDPDTSAAGVFDGVVVGDYFDSNDVSHGFIYDNSMFTTLDDPLGARGTVVTGIYGTTIVGYYLPAIPGAISGFIATPVPEPTSMAILGIGAVALLRRRRHR
jgi:hypothetical protein